MKKVSELFEPLNSVRTALVHGDATFRSFADVKEELPASQVTVASQRNLVE